MEDFEPTGYQLRAARASDQHGRRSDEELRTRIRRRNMLHALHDPATGLEVVKAALIQVLEDLGAEEL